MVSSVMPIDVNNLSVTDVLLLSILNSLGYTIIINEKQKQSTARYTDTDVEKHVKQKNYGYINITGTCTCCCHQT